MRPIIATIGVVAGVCLLISALYAVRLMMPSDGARVRTARSGWTAEGVVVTPLEARPGGLRDGDIVVAVGERSLVAWAGDLSWPGLGRAGWHTGRTASYVIVRDGRTQELQVELEPYPLWQSLARDWGQVTSAVAFILITGFVFALRAGDPAARTLLVASSGILAAMTTSSLQVADIANGVSFWIFLLLYYAAFPLVFSGGLHFALVFPQPNALVARRPTVVPLVYLTPPAITLAVIGLTRVDSVNVLAWLRQWTIASSLITTLSLVLFLVATAYAYRHARDGLSRRQIRLVVFAVLLSTSAALCLGALPELVRGDPLLSLNQQSLIGLIIPVALAAAVLRYRLFDIDIIIHYSLVYGALTLCVIGIYVLVVGYLGQALRAEGSLAISLIAAGVVAVLFQPLRAWLQRSVSRLLYGERDDPYGVMARLGRRLETTLAPEAVLPTIAETVAQTLKLPYAAVRLRQGDAFSTAAVWGTPRGDLLTLPLVYQSETVGQLQLAPRAPGDTFSPADRRVLEGITHQAAIAAHAVHLTADLQRSRERIISAREEERRRLRRDLHDGLGPALAGLAVKIDAAINFLDAEPAAAHLLLVEMKAQTQLAISDIRRVVYDLRPPALDDLGLVPALREYALHFSPSEAASGLRVTVEADEPLPPLPAAVEVAAFRIALESLTNAARHSGARLCTIRIAVTDDVELEVTDDGSGIRDGVQPGVGLTSMRERVEELGGTLVVESLAEGGTRVLARLPLRTTDG